ncbi:MAG TPA: FAD-dependent oxidoreductase [Microbacteriaceae bacterium]|nr:FAD-dependent oxidoreductase [Microbacteriaceae bacterium]
MNPASIAVVGGGVIGRTAALELSAAGHRVTLITADPLEATTSAKAAALVMPFAAHPADRIAAWTVRSIERLMRLVDDASAGVRLVHGYEIHRTSRPELDWASFAPDASEGPAPAGLPEGIASVVSATMPLVDTSYHLAWLRRAGEAAGVEEVMRRIDSVDDAFAYGDLVVLATGLGTNALVPGAGLYPVQGQVVRVANPGSVPWLIDQENPAGLLYVIPRIDEVVVGGTQILGADSVEPDPAVEAAILARASAFFPWIADAPVTSRAVGLRPGRDAVRLERIGDVIHCYGHGGSGVTIAFGCAEEIVALAGT